MEMLLEMIVLFVSGSLGSEGESLISFSGRPAVIDDNKIKIDKKKPKKDPSHRKL